MLGKIITRGLLLSIFILVGLQIWWQTVGPVTTPPQPVPGTYAVDPLFREYYQDLGGMDRLGPAISPLFQRDDARCQFVVSALLCNNPLASDARRFFLAPLGRELVIKEEVSYKVEPGGDLLVDGFVIYSDFVGLYKELGEVVVGQPLTQARYNNEYQRIEQHFENLGFYHGYAEPAGAAHLLAYGAYICDEGCRYDQVPVASVITSTVQISTPFASSVHRLGGLQTFGQPLTQPYETADGMLEQVFENVVIYAPKDNLSVIHLRPLPLLLGMITEPSVPQKYGAEQHIIFYPTEGELGHHVPLIFDQFLASHGGQEISGSPIADTIQYPDENLPRQCFQNYCLDFRENAPDSLKIQLAPLGSRYLKLYKAQIMPDNPDAGQKLLLQASELQPEIPASGSQTILLLVTQEASQKPVPGVVADVGVTLPDGRQYSFQAQPTAPDGLATLTIPPLPDLENGSLVIYRVCIPAADGNSPTCVQDSYLIWNF